MWDGGSPDDRLLPNNIATWGSQDIAIAAFLMLLWRDMYPARELGEGEGDTGMEWDKWGRPPGGFIDLGCVSIPYTCLIGADSQGNGLLVHILVSEVSIGIMLILEHS